MMNDETVEARKNRAQVLLSDIRKLAREDEKRGHLAAAGYFFEKNLSMAGKINDESPSSRGRSAIWAARADLARVLEKQADLTLALSLSYENLRDAELNFKETTTENTWDDLWNSYNNIAHIKELQGESEAALSVQKLCFELLNNIPGEVSSTTLKRYTNETTQNISRIMKTIHDGTPHSSLQDKQYEEPVIFGANDTDLRNFDHLEGVSEIMEIQPSISWNREARAKVKQSLKLRVATKPEQDATTIEAFLDYCDYAIERWKTLNPQPNEEESQQEWLDHLEFLETIRTQYADIAGLLRSIQNAPTEENKEAVAEAVIVAQESMADCVGRNRRELLDSTNGVFKCALIAGGGAILQLVFPEIVPYATFGVATAAVGGTAVVDSANQLIQSIKGTSSNHGTS